MSQTIHIRRRKLLPARCAYASCKKKLYGRVQREHEMFCCYEHALYHYQDNQPKLVSGRTQR